MQFDFTPREPSWQEADRQAAVERYAVLDTPPEAVFDDIVRIAAQICDTPVALVTLLHGDRQWFKASVGVDISETPRGIAFCDHAIRLDTDLMEVRDATLDPRFVDNPLVTGETNVRFYAGAPLTSPEGLPLGTLCVLDTVPHELQPNQAEALRALSRQVVAQMELRRLLAERSAAEEDRRLLLEEAQHRVKNILGLAQAVAGATLRAAPDLATARRALEARFAALGRAHDVLTGDLQDAAPIGVVVGDALSTLGQLAERVTVSGPALTLSSRAVVGLTLALHELGTNAVKYGALSTGTGQVTLDWGTMGEGDRARFEIEWRESGGPTVTAPTRRGFGSRLLRTPLDGAAGGVVEMSYPPSGATWRADLPLHAVAF